MGHSEAARVDVAALLDVARRYDALADVVDGMARKHLSRLNFDGSTAGRAYVDQGRSLRGDVADVVSQLPAWARALREIASALRVSGARYVSIDARGADRLG